MNTPRDRSKPLTAYGFLNNVYRDNRAMQSEAMGLSLTPEYSWWPLRTGQVKDVYTETHTCRVASDDGQDLKNVSWTSPWFGCTNGGGFYSMPEIGARVGIGKFFDGAWYILGYLPQLEDESGESVNNRQSIQQGDMVMGTAYGNFISIRKSAHLIQIKNSENCWMVLENTGDKIAVHSQRFHMRNAAGTIIMTTDEKGNTITEAYLKRKVDDDENFVKLSIGSLSKYNDTSNHAEFPKQAEVDEVIFQLNVCDKFKLSIDTSGNLKINGFSFSQEFIKNITRTSGETILDNAAGNVEHGKASIGGLCGDLGTSGRRNYYYEQDSKIANEVVTNPHTGSPEARKYIGMGGNRNEVEPEKDAIGGNGGYAGDRKKEDPVPPPMPMNGNLTGVDRLIEATAMYEGEGRYDAWTANDAGSGASYGLVQFNQKKGTLPELLKKMRVADPATFDQIMGPHAQNMLSASWVKSANLNDPDIKSRMVEAARLPVFQTVQRELARTGYFVPTQKTAGEFGLKSEKAYAMLFDAGIQFGNGGAHSRMAQASVGSASEQDTLKKFAALCDVKQYRYNTDRRTKILNSNEFSYGDFVP